MKDEQRKKEDRELIERFRDFMRKRHSFGRDYRDEFIKSENLEPKQKLELNRWIVDDSEKEWIRFYSDDCQYGVDPNGEWSYTSLEGLVPLSLKTERYATDEEILDRLSKVAVKMGYKERQSKCFDFSLGSKYIDLNNSYFTYNKYGLWIGDVDIDNLILRDGKWADFIETDSEKIERLEKEVKELKNKIK